MPLASRLSLQFEQRVQSKGFGLFRDRAVRVTEESPRRLAAMVTGGRLYEVRVTYDDNRLLVSCECPYFADFGTCKHLWAAILEADRRGALQDAQNAKYLKLEDELEAEWDYDHRPFALRSPPPQPAPIPAWQEHLTAIQREMEQRKPAAAPWPREFEILYVIDLAASRASGAIVIELSSRTRKKNGEWSTSKPFKVTPAQAGSLPDPADAEAVGSMLGGQEYYSYGYYSTSSTATRKVLPGALTTRLIPGIAATGRLLLRADASAKEMQPAEWDAGEPWKLWLEVKQREGEQWSIEGSLRRGEERMELTQPLLLLESGLLITPGRLARFDAAGAYAWATQLRNAKRITFRDRERDTVLETLLQCEVVPPMELDQALKFEERRVEPRLGLRVTQQRNAMGDESFQAHLLLDYGRGWIEDISTGAGIWLRDERVYLVRDVEAETAAREALIALGLKQANGVWRLAVKPMPRVVRELLQAGWHVEAEGKAFRQPGPARVDISSGIDWFELRAEVNYGDATVNLPQLLEALRRGDTMIPLGDGSFGLLPEEWLQRFAPLAGLVRRRKAISASAAARPVCWTPFSPRNRMFGWMKYSIASVKASANFMA